MDRTRKRDGHMEGRTDGRTVRLLYASQSSFGGIKMLQILILKKSQAQDFQPGPSARTLAFIPDCNFGFRKYWDGCIFVEKTKVLISS